MNKYNNIRYITMQKTKKRSFIFLLFVSLTIFSSCNFYEPVTLGDLQGIEFDEVSGLDVKLDLLVPVNNPNSYDITITGYDLDIHLNDVDMGKATSSESFVIPGKSNEVMKFPAEISVQNAITGAIALFSIMSKKKITVKAKGTMSAKAYFLSKTIDIGRRERS